MFLASKATPAEWDRYYERKQRPSKQTFSSLPPSQEAVRSLRNAKQAKLKELDRLAYQKRRQRQAAGLEKSRKRREARQEQYRRTKAQLEAQDANKKFSQLPYLPTRQTIVRETLRTLLKNERALIKNEKLRVQTEEDDEEEDDSDNEEEDNEIFFDTEPLSSEEIDIILTDHFTPEETATIMYAQYADDPGTHLDIDLVVDKGDKLVITHRGTEKWDDFYYARNLGTGDEKDFFLPKAGFIPKAWVDKNMPTSDGDSDYEDVEL